MSLGFSNTSFPSEVTLDKLEDYYNASYHYNNAPTASLSVSQSFTYNGQYGSGTATSARANNGNIAICYEGTSTVTIVEGLGGTETQVGLGQSNTWRGMVYDPTNDEFVLFSDAIIFINATTFNVRTISANNAFGGGKQMWGGTVVDGKIYVGTYTGTTSSIGLVDVESATFGLISPGFGFNETEFMASCITKNGNILWGAESNRFVKEYSIINNQLNTISNTIQYAGYQGWAPLSDGTLFSSGWNSSQYQIYTPPPFVGVGGTIVQYNKNETNLGPWSNAFQGLDGNAYLVDSNAVTQLGGIYSDVYCYDVIQKNYFKTQFKFPANSTSFVRQNQAILVQEDGWVVSAGSQNDGEYHAVKMFEPTNDITRGSRTAGFSPNTSN
jgi:hypothetical protein